MINPRENCCTARECLGIASETGLASVLYESVGTCAVGEGNGFRKILKYLFERHVDSPATELQNIKDRIQDRIRAPLLVARFPSPFRPKYRPLRGQFAPIFFQQSGDHPTRRQYVSPTGTPLLGLLCPTYHIAGTRVPNLTPLMGPAFSPPPNLLLLPSVPPTSQFANYQRSRILSATVSFFPHLALPPHPLHSQPPLF